MVRTVVLGLVALAVLATGASAQQAYEERSYTAPVLGPAVKDSVCSNASWRDTVYLSDWVDAPAGTMHVAVDFASVYSWSVEVAPDDNDVGVWVWALQAYNGTESDSFLVRQNTTYFAYVPVKAWYFRGANATADSCVIYNLRFDGKP